MALTIRPFQDADYPRIVAIYNRCEPDAPWSEASARHADASWDYTRFERRRLVALLDGGVAGYGQISHMIYTFHPQHYWLHVMVDPALRRRGAGSALHTALIEQLRQLHATLARTEVADSRAETIQFLAHRGYVEVRQSWESRLDVSRFDFDPFRLAPPRISEQGITLTNVAAERERRPDWLQQIFDLESACTAGEPSLDPVTPPPFDYWSKRMTARPDLLPEGQLLAVDGPDGGAYVGLSFLNRDLSLPHVLQQSFTGVLPAYRGRGIAMALKLAGIRFAKEHGYREIRTTNDSLNRPMLRINEALGFVRQPPHLTFQKAL